MTREEAARIIKKCKDNGFKHTFYTLTEYHTALDMAIEALDQEPCTDAISRKYIQEQYFSCADMLHPDVDIVMEWVEDAPSVSVAELEQTELKPSYNSIKTELDLISRQAAIDAIDNMVRRKFGIGCDLGEITLSELPSVSTEKTGRWIKIKPYPLQMHDYECSECKHETDDNTEKYCCECGCRMMEVEE